MKKQINQFVILWILGLMLSGCSGAQSASLIQPQDCKSPTEWKIDLNLSGGIAGLARSLSISSNGNVIWQDLRNSEKRQSTLTHNELAKIAGMLADACPFENNQPVGVCADCFEYTLNVIMNGKPYILKTSDINIPETSAQLIEYLRNFITR